jgi:peptide/nickel transport system substrate-binding protein
VASDGTDVVFSLSQPYVALPYYCSDIYIVPKHIWENVADISQELNTVPVGSGPFVWRSYTTGTDVQFDAFKDYWQGAPKVDELIVNLYNSSPNMTLALLAGEIAATMGTMAMPSIPEFMTKDNAEMQVFPGFTNYSVIVNHENELLADPVVRKAMAMAINQADLISKGEYNGVYPTSAGWLPEVFGELYSEEAAASLTFDAAGAMALLESAGYTKGDDGIYQKDGKRLSFTYHNASGAPAQQMEAGMNQQWLLNIGIEILPRLATWPELTQLLQTGGFDLLQNGIGFPADPYAALNTSFHSSMTAPIGEATQGTNYFRYRNDEVDALLDEVSGVTDFEQQKVIYAQIQQIIADDAVFLPMYNLGGHIPYYDGGVCSGWISDAPIFSNRGIIEVYMLAQ